MPSFLHKVFLICVLTLLFVHSIVGVRVNVNNMLEGNLDLTLHCKSKDDDLGVQLLHHGQSFSWKFGPRFPPIIFQTLFFCSFAWTGESHYFDIYVQGDKKLDDCDYCNWNVFKSGPCRIQEIGDPICFPWNKSQIM